VSLVLRKKKKTSVAVDTPRSSKPIAVVLSSAAFAGTCAILFNAFFNHATVSQTQLNDDVDAKTRVTVVANQKTSRTITLKYDALVEDIQRELLSTGHFNGLVDGVTGPKTLVAIEAYQRENKLDLTGEISASLLEHIRYTRKVNQAAEFTGSVTPREPAQNLTIQPLAQLPKPAKKLTAKPIATKPTDNAVAKIQQRLAMLGYDPGSRSGQMDEGTRSAILIFEMDHGIPMEGKISKALLGALKTAELKKKN
jgi:peptidoglycan hydrolase-like protein with peptidoglycan-binding domain